MRRAFTMGRAFTLVELMISMALVLIVALGVSAVFRWTGQTINAGQTSAAAMRNYRAAMSIMTQDFRGCASDSPAFVIYSARIGRNVNFSEQVRLTSDYVSPSGYAAFERYYNGYFDASLQFDYRYPRIHRADIVRFFSRGLFRRQTANEGSFTSTTTSGEAFITYGHVSYWGLDDPAYPGRVVWYPPEPVYSRNPSYLASDWTLGRSVILLKDKDALSGETYIRRESDTSPAPYPPNSNANTSPPYKDPWKPVPWPWWYPDPLNPSAGWQPTFNLSPLCYGSPASSPSNSYLSPDQIQDSRYDIADTSIDGYRQIVATARARQALFPLPPPGPYATPVRIVRWWHPLVFRGMDFLGGDNPPDVRYAGGGHPRFAWTTPGGRRPRTFAITSPIRRCMTW